MLALNSRKQKNTNKTKQNQSKSQATIAVQSESRGAARWFGPGRNTITEFVGTGSGVRDGYREAAGWERHTVGGEQGRGSGLISDS